MRSGRRWSFEACILSRFEIECCMVRSAAASHLMSNDEQM